jgi:hypothetical protein
MLFITVLALVVTAPLAAYASHRFVDVPTSHTFHNDITWLADNGITLGCNPPANTMYCPSDPVNRGQMAAFLHRFNDQVVAEGVGEAVGLGFLFRDLSASAVSGNGAILSMNLNIEEPGVVVLQASSWMQNFADFDTAACGISSGSTSSALGDSWRPIDLNSDTLETCATQTAFPVAAGSQLVRLIVAEALSTTQTLAASIAAVFYPLDTTAGLLSTAFAKEVPVGHLEDGLSKTTD